MTVGNGDSISESTTPRSLSTRQEATGSNHNRRGMILPFEPHSITFDEVTYAVDMPQVMQKQITYMKEKKEKRSLYSTFKALL